MAKRKKRIWTDEERKAAGDRMRAAQTKRWADKLLIDEQVSRMSPAEMQSELNQRRNLEIDSNNLSMTPKVRDPEVQAVLDSMTPERRAKLAAIQSKTLATEEGQQAIRRAENLKVHQQMSAGVTTVVSDPSTGQVLQRENVPPYRIGSHEVNLIVRTDGTMVSRNGPCVCGAPKRQWHVICVKEVSHVTA